MPNDVDANQTKQVHHVAKPNTPRNTSVVNTDFNESNAKWNSCADFITDASSKVDDDAVGLIGLWSLIEHSSSFK